MLPQVNASLLAIHMSNQVSEDWDVETATAGPVIWQGNEDAYVMEKMRTTFSEQAGGLSRQKDVTMIIPSGLVNGAGDLLELKEGQIITYTYRGITYMRRIRDFSAPYLPGMNVSEYIRMHMDPETVEATQVVS